MLAQHRTAEEWTAELDSIIDDYRNAAPKGAPRLSRQQAIERLVELGLSEGEAIYYLDGHSAKPAAVHS
jgi:hypothetical protein